MNFRDLYEKAIQITHPSGDDEPILHSHKEDGQPVCPNSPRETPCPNCPNVLPTIAHKLGMKYMLPDVHGHGDKKRPARAIKNDHIIWVEDGFLVYKHIPSGSANKVHIKHWKKFTETLEKVVNAKLEW